MERMAGLEKIRTMIRGLTVPSDLKVRSVVNVFQFCRVIRPVPLQLLTRARAQEKHAQFLESVDYVQLKTDQREWVLAPLVPSFFLLNLKLVDRLRRSARAPVRRTRPRCATRDEYLGKEASCVLSPTCMHYVSLARAWVCVPGCGNVDGPVILSLMPPLFLLAPLSPIRGWPPLLSFRAGKRVPGHHRPHQRPRTVRTYC